MKAGGCARCQALERELLAARKARDEALLALAREREQVNALRLAIPATSAEAPPAYPVSVQPGPPPMRYLLVDSANTALKRYLGPLHRGTRQAAKLALKALASAKSEGP